MSPSPLPPGTPGAGVMRDRAVLAADQTSDAPPALTPAKRFAAAMGGSDGPTDRARSEGKRARL